MSGCFDVGLFVQHSKSRVQPLRMFRLVPKWDLQKVGQVDENVFCRTTQTPRLRPPLLPLFFLGSPREARQSQRTTNEERRTKNEERRTKNKEQRTKNKEQTNQNIKGTEIGRC